MRRSILGSAREYRLSRARHHSLWRQYALHRSALRQARPDLRRRHRIARARQRARQGTRRFATSIFFSRTVISITSSGLPFFAPFFIEGYRVRIWAGNLLPAESIEHVMRKIMSSPLFPVEVEIFKAKIEFHDFQFRRYFASLRRRDAANRAADHPDGASGYRLEYGGRVFCVAQRHRRVSRQARQDLVALARDADLVVYDGTFTEEEIASRQGWGHSTWRRGIRLADEAGAKQLCLFHHDPSHDDDFMDMLAADANDARPGTMAAREGQIVDI